jgi:ABC-type glutathione transport system ATPase component
LVSIKHIRLRKIAQYHPIFCVPARLTPAKRFDYVLGNWKIQSSDIDGREAVHVMRDDVPVPPGNNGTNAAPVLAVEGVTKSFGGIAALKDVHFDLFAGEIHSLMGEN